MKSVSILFAFAALVAGLLAARYWYKSSKISIGQLGPNWALPGTGGPIEPTDPEVKALDMSVANWMDSHAIVTEITRAALLNKLAALWTAGSVVAGAISAVLGALAN